MTDALSVIDPDEPDERPQQALTLFGTSDPIAVLGQASRVALALATVIKKQGLFTRIGNKEYVHVEGWTLLGSMLGVFAQIEWTRKLEDGWEARATATAAASGAVIGAGEAQCLRSESTWARRDDYALRGMAQTRAISRALRGPLGFVVELAGFAATPADEMPSLPTADEQFHANETARRAGTVPPVTSANSVAPSPAPKTPQETFAGARAHVKAYADDDAVCPGCGQRDFLRPYKGSYFCSKRDGGCGSPPKGEVMNPISFGEFRARQSH
jgi:hypothetical protein